MAFLVGRGLTNAQISSELGISSHAVANHAASILDKLGFSSRSRVAVRVAASKPEHPE